MKAPIMTNPFDLSRQTAVVTGGSRGLGFAIARSLAEAGARVIITARDAERLAAAAAELTAEGHAVVAHPFDLADEAACVAAAADIAAAHGDIAILINNAGINAWQALEEATVATWQRVINTNLTGSYLLAREFARGMVARRYGRIVNVGSALSVAGREKLAAYTASKHGIAGLSRALAAELGPHGVTCNVLAPGYFKTEINIPILARPGFEAAVNGRIPLRRWGEPEEIGGIAVFMASRASAYMNGHVLVADGGLTETFVLPTDA